MQEQFPLEDQEPNPTQQFINAVWSVHEYNMDHTQKSDALRKIINLLFLTTGFITPEQITDQDESEKMDRELVKMIQTEKLVAMGIGIFDPGILSIKGFVTDPADEPTDCPSSLMMVVQNTDLFLDTIGRLQPTDETREITKIAVNTVLSTSASIVQEAYSNEFDADPEFQKDIIKLADDHLKMFYNARPLLTAKKLDGTHTFSQLSEYLTRQQADTLSDYTVAEVKGYLNGPDQYGPASWQRNITANKLLIRWMRAQGHLLNLRDREQPSPFYSELFKKLRSDFDTSMYWIMERSEQNERFWSLREPFEKVNEFWASEFPIENSFYHAERAELGVRPIAFNPNDKKPESTSSEISPEDRWWNE